MKLLDSPEIRMNRSFAQFLSLSVYLLVSIWLVRLFDALIISYITNLPDGSWYYHLIGAGYDLLFVAQIMLWLIIPLVLIGYKRLELQRSIFVTVAPVLVLINLLLVFYFSKARVPLGADLFGYSFEEITHTVSASGGLNVINVILFLVLVILFFWGFRKVPVFPVKPVFRHISMLMLTVVFFFGSSLKPQSTGFKNEFDLFVSCNKLMFFANSLSNYSTEQSDESDSTYANLSDSGEQNELTREYVSEEYPLLHKEKTPDVIGPFFATDSVQLPSIVFIITESLGRSYSGANAVLGSFTPFLDSLMQRSLYWENCLSSSGRTFEVLPTLLGSLPFGKNGFTEMGEQMPDHHTIISLLRKNGGYQSSFYYGGDPHFDNMDLFLRRQGTQNIVGISDFGSKYKKMPASDNGFSWGYGDRDIFQKYLDDAAGRKPGPRIDVMLTLAMHDPFRVPNQQQYNQRVEARIQSLNLTGEQKQFNREYIPQFASMLYYDDALRSFFTQFHQRKEFANTIFIITGDHRMPEIPISTQIDRFHVPLVIYSPMLKTGKTFSAVVSHFDVAPTLLALLRKTYKVKMPTLSAWIGGDLDTHPEFRSRNSYPLMRNKSEFMDYLEGDYFLSGETLYSLFKNNYIEPTDNDSAKVRLSKRFSNFKKINRFVTEKNRIIPDSIKIAP
jgi:uncharacterized sulfatase